MSKTKLAILVIVILAVCAGAYYYLHTKQKAPQSTNGASAGKAEKGGGAVSVFTAPAQKKDYSVNLTASGVVTALNIVDVRPQVASTIAKVHIREGQFVRAGDLLFSLDSRVDEVNVTKAQAQLDKDMATLADNQRQLDRNKELLDKKFLSQSAVDSSLTQLQAQQAVVASDKAAVAAARVALGYNRIVAPAAGRTGIINVYVGSYVQPNTTALPLVTITQIDPISVTFPLPQRSLPDALASMKKQDSFVTAHLPGVEQEFKGKLQFIDNQVDASSGTVKVKAIFENINMQLWPGAYVDVALSVQTIKDAIVIPQDAVIVGVKSNSVYIVGDDNKAAMKPIQILYTSGDDAVVIGLAAGMKVVREGKQSLRPGTPVRERGADAAAPDKVASGHQKGGAKPSEVAGSSSPSSTGKAVGAP